MINLSWQRELLGPLVQAEEYMALTMAKQTKAIDLIAEALKYLEPNDLPQESLSLLEEAMELHMEIIRAQRDSHRALGRVIAILRKGPQLLLS